MSQHNRPLLYRAARWRNRGLNRPGLAGGCVPRARSFPRRPAGDRRQRGGGI